MTDGDAIFQNIQTQTLESWLHSMRDGQTIRVIRNHEGWLWLQCVETKQVFICEDPPG